MIKGFWETIKKPIIAVSPMDGVTDAPFRYIVAKHGPSAVSFTEFTNVEGLARGAVSMLKAFRYSEVERPVVAQIYGVEEESYYKVALMLCHLGFDGIDINMGCPANKVARRNSGAGLIRIPKHAQKLVLTTKQAVKDWSEGITLEKAGIRPKIINHLKAIKPEEGPRIQIPVSVKTRTGVDKIVTEEWISTLLETEPANLSLHGRTLKQMYTGHANWEEIGKAAALCRPTETSFLGNGDVMNLDDAYRKIKEYDTDGVLVGRGTLGNPWFFKAHTPTTKERIKVAVEHCKAFEELMPDLAFFNMRKHLGWYCKGFDGARELRSKLMQTNSSEEVEAVFKDFMS